MCPSETSTDASGGVGLRRPEVNDRLATDDGHNAAPTSPIPGVR
jgi:hypothetical protein